MKITTNRNKQIAKILLEKVITHAKIITQFYGRTIRFMEVCGTHTVSISKSGLRDILKDYMILASGPGCPVCVTDYRDIDKVIALCKNYKNITIATFGDMVKVPGSRSSLEKEKAKGASVKIFYGPDYAVEFAKKHPNHEVVFLAVGFETTMPVIALALERAITEKIKNFSILSLGKLVPPAINSLLEDPEFEIDGFILPGHVSAIIGRKAQNFIASDYEVPAVIAGFEEIDILYGLNSLLTQILKGNVMVDNQYRRLVKENGNLVAQKILNKYFQKIDAPWRGLGVIKNSGLALKDKYKDFDATYKFPVDVEKPIIPKGCRCGDLLKGKILPINCRLFGEVCTPLKPVGPCMVSSEGACAAWYNYS